MIRRPPRSTLDRSSAASDVYKRQSLCCVERSICPTDRRERLHLYDERRLLWSVVGGQATALRDRTRMSGATLATIIVRRRGLVALVWILACALVLPKA